MIVFILFILLVPFLLGLWWNNLEYDSFSRALLFRYISGFCMLFALFELVSIPFCFLNRSMTELTLCFSVVLVVACALGVVFFLKQQNNDMERLTADPQSAGSPSDGTRRKPSKSPRWTTRIASGFPGPRKLQFSRWEAIYAAIFAVLLLVQIVSVAILDIGGRAADDATYVALCNDAITHNVLYRIDPMTGVPAPFDFLRGLQGSLLLFAYLAKITGLHVASIFHTYMAVVLLIVAYGVYFLLADALVGSGLPERKETVSSASESKHIENTTKKNSAENKWIFLIFLSVLYIFGYYSDYSMTFRLLGPIWQGKAILEVILTPLLFLVLPVIYKSTFQWRHAIYLGMLGTAAISMTMGGAIVMVAMTVLLGILFFREERDKRHILYVLFGCGMPGVCSLIYVLMR